MGTITYDGAILEFDDRLLTHLQIVIMNRFRHGEGFVMSWLDSVESGDGRSSVWLSPNMAIYFKFFGSRVPEVNERWLATLAESAESTRGLVVTEEDGSLARASRPNRRW